ncbi:MAG: Zn-ribbon domain-containing OB-fold protein, partial [Dehalococcoidales bacterium]|nr:Zn-ribbon domain-containing OB-fold protein [Dehalococcoidales bacterium]
DFMTYLEAGKVMATRCKKCRVSYFPPKADCPRCLSSDVEWFEIKGKGKLNTYTMVNYGPTGFENDAPYILALAEFDGIQIFGRLSRDIEEKDIKVGMSLVVSPVKLPDNRIAYEFKKG